MVITCKKPCKKKRSTMVTVEQMVDIALGTPEIGAVNFNVLHALIHVIVQQLNIQKYLVEFKGYDSERMEGIILCAKPGPIIKLSEYMVETGDGKQCPAKCRETKKDDEEDKQKDKNLSPKRLPCECICEKKKKSIEDDREKTDKPKAESDTEGKKTLDKKIKQELTMEECDETEEPKKIRDFKPKSRSCPCKVAKERVPIVDEEVRAATSSYYGSDTEVPCQTIVRVEPIGERCDSWRSRPALAHESMVKLEEKVAMLQDAFEALEQMPTNDEIKKKSQNPGCTATPVKDLWQLYNLHKRVESCEGTIEKMASMIEDLVKETCNFKEAMMVIAGAVDEIECADQTARLTCCAALQGQTGNPFATSATESPVAHRNVNFQNSDDPEEQRPTGKCNGQPCFENNSRNAQDRRSTQVGESSQEGADGQGRAFPRLEDGFPMPDASPFNADTDGNGIPIQGAIGPEFYKMSAHQKFCVLKNSIDCLMCQMKSLAEKLPFNQIAAKLCVLVSMQKQLDALEKEWRAFLEGFGHEGVTVLQNTSDSMKSEFDNLHNLITQLNSDKHEMEVAIKNLLQEIENLKRVKADFEIVEDLLAEKADASVVNRKVSHDQFDAACDDLTRGLDETLDKLMQQEAMWNEAMEELQKDLDNKLDKNEIMPLKEFINKKLKCLQEKLKQLAQLRKDAEAAGAKSRILRNLNCIACDGDVVMKMDNMVNYQCPTLPPSKSIKPILTYELDQVRKAMKKGPCRSVNQVEEAIMDVQKKLSGIPLTQREAVESKISKLAHFCNRYCGGSHTVTTPQQRVTRIGHFLTEFGPQAMAMFNQDNLDNKNPLCPSANITPEVDLQKPCV